jgi:hypothetical protein
LEKVLATMRADITSGTIAEARRGLRTFIQQVIVRDEELEIVYLPESLAGIAGFKGVPPRGFEPLHQA